MNMNHDITKGWSSMSGNEATSSRRRRKATTIGIVGLVGLSATVAGLVPVSQTTHAQETAPDHGMVCEWGDGTSGFTPIRTFTLTAASGYTTEPDGNAIFNWSYTNPTVRSFQLPGPNLCANTGEAIKVVLTNDLLVPTSIEFPGQSNVTYDDGLSTGPVGPTASPGGELKSLVQGADHGASITYSFPAAHEGTFLYQSGTDPQLQVQMGLYGSMVIYPFTDAHVPVTINGPHAGEANCAYRSLDDPTTCDSDAVFEADRENILVLSEVDPGLHSFIEQEQQAGHTTKLNSNGYTVGYAAHYFLINGRSMPDTIAPNNAAWLPAQPYGSMATVEPFDPVANPLDAMIRYVGVGVVGYDFHPHSNHEHVIALDGSLMKTAIVGSTPGIDATEEKFNILVGAGVTVDATFRWTNEEGYKDKTGSRVPVQWPQSANLMEGDFWSGSPYLANTTGKLNPGIIGKTQCGEYYHVAHNHDLTQVTNYGITFGGMLTLIKVEPPESVQGDLNLSCNG